MSRLPMTSVRRSPALAPETTPAAHRPRRDLVEQTSAASAAPSQRAAPRNNNDRRSHATIDGQGTSSFLDAEALLAHPLMRDLIYENEGMLMELAGLRETQKMQRATEMRLLTINEQGARAAVSAAEALTRAAFTTAAHRSLVRRVVELEHALSEEEAAKIELRNFAELAQAQLASSSVQTSAKEGGMSSSSSSRRRVGGGAGAARDSGVTDSDVESLRTSLEEITNLRGSMKRLRSVENSECGTPREQPPRLSGAQRSPGALTKARKTMH